MTESSTSAQAPEANPPDDRQPIDIARDMLARALESEFPGVTISHGPYGWSASRDGAEICRGQSGPALRALIPYTDPGPSATSPEGDVA